MTEQTETIKSGARNNSDDRKRIRDMRSHARAIQDITVEMEPDDEDRAPTPPNVMKADDLGFAAENVYTLQVIGAVKAAGEWELEVLGVPFGGPNAGKDAHGEFFSPNTNLYLDKIKSTLAVYYHGYLPEGKPAGQPEIIGEITSSSKRADGWWFRVILDRASAFAKRVWEAAKAGTARASSGSIAHLVRIAQDGEILHWPLAELSIFDTEGKRQPANAYAVALPVIKSWQERGLLPAIPANEAESTDAPMPDTGGAAAQAEAQDSTYGGVEMDETKVSEIVAAALKADREARDAEAQAKASEEAKIKAAVEAEKAKWEAEAAKARRLPDGAPTIAKFSDEWAYDNLEPSDHALVVGLMQSNARKGAGPAPSVPALKSLARKLESDKTPVGEVSRQAMKMAGVKADELDYSTLASYGDEWVGIAYSQSIWDAIRVGTFVASRIPSMEVPRGMESVYLPLESTDPVFYKVAENTTYDATMKYPVATVASSRLGTGRVQLTLSKLGARGVWSGEMEERSLIQFAPQLRRQLVTSGAQYFESAIIDGDTTTTATTNINDIASTGAQAGTEHYLLFNGFRKSPLVTTTANSRSAAGSFSASDFLATVKLMGGAGINALDRSKVSFIIDPLTHYKALELPEVKTRDVFNAATIEGGQLAGIYGYDVNVAGYMNFSATNRLSNSAGKVDQDVVGNNLYGSILAVRWDQWMLGYQRRMTLETFRWPQADTNEIVVQMVVGLIQRDTEASSITYYVGV